MARRTPPPPPRTDVHQETPVHHSSAPAGRETFGARLHRLRVQAGLTCHALADQAGLHVGAIWKLEAGQRTDPALSTALALCRALGLPPAVLLEGLTLPPGAQS